MEGLQPAGEPVPAVKLDRELINNNCLKYFKNFVDQTSVLYQKAFLSSFPADFARDMAHDELPAVSWMVAPTIPRT